MEHCPGRKNIIADLLSRQHPDKHWEKERDIIQVAINALKYKFSMQLKNDLTNLQQLQKEDTQLMNIIETIEKEKANTHRFEIHKEILYQRTAKRKVIYLPKKKH